jgi:non-specific protein-tyrosine kinase
MEIRGYLQTLWKWRRLLIICTLGAGIAGFLVSSLIPPTYEARVLLMSNQSTNTGFIDYSSLLGQQQVFDTYPELLRTRVILESVISNLGLKTDPERLVKQIEITPLPDTQLLEVKVQNENAQRAADIANEIVLTFLNQRYSEQQVQDIELYEYSVTLQMTSLDRAIEITKADIERARAISGLLTQQELVALQSHLTQQQTTYASLLAGYLNLQAQKSQLLDVVVAEPAYAPSEDIGPSRLLYSVIAAASGGIIAASVAFFIEYLNDTFDTPEEAQQVLGLPDLGSIPLIQLSEGFSSMRITNGRWSPLGEAFRVLRTNIEFVRMDESVRTILVTSPSPGEGKTSMVVNLGIVMAQNGLKVLLVGTDLRHSSLHRVLDIPNKTGFTSLLLESGDLASTVVNTYTENLYVLPSGPLPPNPSELLGSPRVVELIEELQAFAEIIIFDAPPVLVCADAIVLSSRVDGVLFVVDSTSTRKDAAVRALSRLTNVKANILGVILNKAKVGSSEYSYYTNGAER